VKRIAAKKLAILYISPMQTRVANKGIKLVPTFLGTFSMKFTCEKFVERKTGGVEN